MFRRKAVAQESMMDGYIVANFNFFQQTRINLMFVMRHLNGGDFAFDFDDFSRCREAHIADFTI